MIKTLILRAGLLALAGLCACTLGCGSGSSTPAVGGSVAATQNPLVAQYTVVSGCAGPAMVEFGPDTSYGRSTSWYPSSAGANWKFVIQVAGMQASTTYHMRPQVQCNGETVAGADTTFTTGPLPSLAFPTLTVSRPNPSSSSPENPGIEMITVTVANTPALFTDRDANPIWYYDVGQGNFPFTFKLLPDGNIVLSITTKTGSLLREVDLAGNTIRELDISSLQQQAQTAGYDFQPSGLHHDVLPLANGHLIVLVNCFKDYPELAGYTGPVTVQGDAIIDLDENWNAVWAWNSFDYLDVTRHLQPFLANGVLDWTHSNALLYSPSDGNILVSMRHQSWVLKIDYNNGAGTGNVLWHLGYQGDFALNENGVPTTDPSQWFSFQHFPVILNQSGSQTDFAIWDNGDNRVLDSSGSECLNPTVGTPACYSRATIFQVDESSMTANLEWADVQTDFGNWGGSINQFANGNVEFDMNAPALPPAPNVASRIEEVTQDATPLVVWQMDIAMPAFGYRAYRVPSLYNGVTWQY